MSDRRLLALCVGSEENRRAEYPLKRGNQPPILGTALLHPENIQHFGRAAKGNGLFLLSHSKRRQENRNQAILAPGYAICADDRSLAAEIDRFSVRGAGHPLAVA